MPRLIAAVAATVAVVMGTAGGLLWAADRFLLAGHPGRAGEVRPPVTPLEAVARGALLPLAAVVAGMILVASNDPRDPYTPGIVLFAAFHVPLTAVAAWGLWGGAEAWRVAAVAAAAAFGWLVAVAGVGWGLATIVTG